MAGDCLIFQEESPDYNEAGFHLTDGYRKIRESATENKPLFIVRVKRRGKSSPDSKQLESHCKPNS